MSTTTKKLHRFENLRITEKYGLTGNVNIYTTLKEQDKFLRLSIDEDIDLNVSKSHFVYNFCRKVFLPQGYPKTVSEDYFEYQFYDTIQAFASRITGTIATKSILKSVGVGNAEATPLSAAITWIFKDGVGMFGGILFAWFKGSEFDSNCKRWRLFADILNDFAMFFELLLPFFAGNITNLSLLCVTTSMKSVVGVAGSATRAAVIQHQAVAENAADVAAKDGSQETAVNLVASIVGIFLLTLVEDSRFEMTLFVLFTALHLLANLFAVKSLVFKGLNAERLVIISKSYVRFDSIPSPNAVNRSESVFLWSRFSNTSKGFCGFNIKLGNSFQNVITAFQSSDLRKIIHIHKHKPYLLIPDVQNKNIHILLKFGETSDIILTSYFHALIFGLGYHIDRDLELECLKKRTAQTSSLLARLKSKLEGVKIEDLADLLKAINEFVDEEGSLFLYELEKKGWKTNVHSINLDDWRMENFEYTD